MKHITPLSIRHTRKQFSEGPMSTRLNPLTSLPYELIYRILSFMQPEQYTGLACSCRLALQLTNSQVEVEQPGLTSEYPMFVSYTAICTALQEAEDMREMIEMEETSCQLHFDLPLPLEDEPDLEELSFQLDFDLPPLVEDELEM